jgi:fructokinase
MKREIVVIGEALMDCFGRADGTLLPVQGGSPCNMARAAARRGALVSYLGPLSTDRFGAGLRTTLEHDGVHLPMADSRRPTSLAVVQIVDGHAHYGFYREGVADRDWRVHEVVAWLRGRAPGILHTGSLMLIPPESEKVIELMDAARALGWTLSIDVNLRPRVADDGPAYLRAVRCATERADWLKASDDDLSSLGHTDATPAQAADLVAALRQAAHAGCLSRIALTFGAQGAHLDIEGAASLQGAPSVDVVDTVGAGDTFWGNCLADWAEAPAGAATRLVTTLRLAMVAAALNCTRQGCQPPALQETLAFEQTAHRPGCH